MQYYRIGVEESPAVIPREDFASGCSALPYADSGRVTAHCETLFPFSSPPTPFPDSADEVPKASGFASESCMRGVANEL
jgi:hypothetical protein